MRRLPVTALVASRPGRARLTAAAVAFALAVSACGGSGPGTSKAAPTSSSSTSPSPGSSSTSAAPAAFTPAPLRWHACAASEGPTKPGYQCATLKVPIDPSKPGGTTIDLALDRRRATGQRTGSLLVNPGGPGEPVVSELPSLVGMFGQDLQSHFDIVGFDPPGVGHSHPITCLSPPAYARYLHQDPVPPGPNPIGQAVAESKPFAEGCQAVSGAILPHVGTIDDARDMEYVRQALGQGKLNYIGFSWGTLLGATYAQLFGANIRSMVLDGAIDPSLSITSSLQAQNASLQTQFNAFTSGCQNDPACAWHQGGGSGGDLQAAFEQLLERVRQHPIPVGKRSVGPAELFYGTLLALYSTQLWPAIYQALANAESGDGTVMLAAFDQYVGGRGDGTFNNSLEAENAVNCLDDPAPPLDALAAALPSFEAASPVFGESTVLGEVGCSVWPVPATDAPHLIAAPQAPPIVVVGSTGDPVTPYAAAQHLAAQLAHGVLLTRDGSGHTGYGASTCISQKVDAYLLNLAVPPPATSCPSDTGSASGA